MKKNFVFDTNVLLHDPRAIFKFDDNDVVLPIYVLEEVDSFKKNMSELGRNAREISRILDRLREHGDLLNGVELPNGGRLRVSFETDDNVHAFLSANTPDNRIISVALAVAKREPDAECIFLTKDVNLRIRADALGLKTENYEERGVMTDQTYTGAAIAHVSAELIAELVGTKSVEIDLDDVEVFRNAEDDDNLDTIGRLFVNQYVLLKYTGDNQTTFARVTATSEDGQQATLTRLKPLGDTTWGLKPRNKEQLFALDALLDDSVDLVTLVGKAGTGKAQPLDAKLMTPRGWTTMGEIAVGDEVISVDGAPTRVLGVFPQGDKDIYEVTFSDGSTTRCCAEHLWHTWTTLDRDYGREGSVKSLEEIADSLRYGTQQKRNHSIPVADPIQLVERLDQPIDPWLLGVLLGDGGISVGSLCLSTKDAFIVDNVSTILEEHGCGLSPCASSPYDFNVIAGASGAPPMGVERIHPETGEVDAFESVELALASGDYCRTSIYRAANGTFSHHKGYAWRATPPSVSSTNPIKAALIDLGLWGKRSEAKFIPEPYLFGSVAQRTAILQGLMDTDGTVDKRGYVSFTTTSPELSEHVRFLVQSLGGVATVSTRRTTYTHNGQKRTGMLSYRLTLILPNEVTPFRLPRKCLRLVPRTKYFPRRYVESVELVGREPAQCIMVEHPTHLYVTDECIVTHNTLLAIASGLKQVTDDQKHHKLLVSRPVIPMGRDIGFLPGTMEEKLGPWMRPIFDNVEYLMGLSKADKRAGRGANELIDMGLIELEALTYIRGRSLPHQYMIIDEAQNLTPHEVKTVLTRVGEGTKIVLTGDPHQIDNPYVDSESNGLTYVIERFKGQPRASSVTLFKGERSALAELAADLL